MALGGIIPGLIGESGSVFPLIGPGISGRAGYDFCAFAAVSTSLTWSSQFTRSVFAADVPI